MIARQNPPSSLDHPPYSPDLSPTDIYFFKHLENFLQEKRFRNLRDAETAFNELVAFRIVEFYDTAQKELVLRLQKCDETNGSNFD
ncbi:histone-lysine N-methyltransferase SETMAR [Trichonephila clavipes]|uniref:Histone-lysine N-methyltransferase SETMAR n=1 Tax=Trichonephila clavipes TaxID=2585209 RepID=A0A8X6UQE1_TRICX|nr:histone-lysine N-methyltransferase SETMAR [Trichonephila clavipes]